MKCFLLIILLAIAGSTFGQSQADSVSVCFQKFKAAVAEGSGNEAAEVIAAKTIEHYQSLLNIALEGDSMEVASLGLLDRLVVIAVRNQLSRAEVLKLNGKSFIAYAVDQGMLSKNSITNFQLGETRTTSRFTTSQIIVGEMETPLKIHFYDEQGWKLDVTPILTAMGTSLSRTVSTAGMSETEWIIMTVQSFSGKLINGNIWLPMQ